MIDTKVSYDFGKFQLITGQDFANDPIYLTDDAGRGVEVVRATAIYQVAVRLITLSEACLSNELDNSNRCDVIPEVAENLPHRTEEDRPDPFAELETYRRQVINPNTPENIVSAVNLLIDAVTELKEKIANG